MKTKTETETERKTCHRENELPSGTEGRGGKRPTSTPKNIETWVSNRKSEQQLQQLPTKQTQGHSWQNKNIIIRWQQNHIRQQVFSVGYRRSWLFGYGKNGPK